MAIPLIAAGLGTALSLLGESERVKEERRLRDAQRKALEEAKITTGEQEQIISGVNRKFNTADLGEMNSAALGLSGILNSDTVRGLNASKLLGRRTEALVDTEQSIRDSNRQVDMQLASLEGQSSSVNIGNVIGGGLMGYQIGESINKLVGTNGITPEVATEGSKTSNQTYADVSSQLDFSRKANSNFRLTELPIASLEGLQIPNSSRPSKNTAFASGGLQGASNSIKTNNINIGDLFNTSKLVEEEDILNSIDLIKLKNFFGKNGAKNKQMKDITKFF